MDCAFTTPPSVTRRVWLSLGAVLGELGRDREALEALGRLPLYLDDAFGMPRALLLSARSLERLGRRDEALRDVDELLALWKHADADLPELAEARALRGRLVTSGARVRR